MSPRRTRSSSNPKVLLKGPGPLERYNQKLLAILGTMVLTGILGLAVFIPGMMIYSWVTSSPDLDGMELQPPEEQAGTRTKVERIQFGEIINRKGSDIIMIPVTYTRELKSRLELGSGAYERKRRFGVVSYGNISSSYSHRSLANVVFKNEKTGKEWLFLKNRGVVDTFYVPADYRTEISSEDEEHPFENKLFWGIQEKDTNSDGLLNDKDECIGFMTDWDGGSRVKLTADGDRLEDVTLDWVRQRVYIKVLKDSNGDGVLDKEDTVHVYGFSIDEPDNLLELISPKIQAELDSMRIKEKE